MDLILAAKSVALLMLPPGGNLVGLVLGLLIARRWRRSGLTIAAISVVMLLLLSMRPVSTVLMQSLERYPPRTPEQLASAGAQAIVVMGGGRSPQSPEYGGDTVSSSSLARVRFASRVAKATGLPVAVTGGSVFGEAVSEAQLMAEAMEVDFGVSVRWREERARNSAENALYTFDMLTKVGIKRVIVVTHAYHLFRTVKMFEQAGFSVAPAGTVYTLRGDRNYSIITDLLPSMHALNISTRTLHEYLGVLWYAIRY
jgi:uncharacterized SAM-binding protein YcdF (DUF218 family)